MFEDLAIAGIPLIVITFALVEMFKSLGLKGDILTIFSIIIGVGLYSLYVAASPSGLPTTFAEWTETIIIGLMFGLSASGIYKFTDARFPKNH